VEAVDDVLEIDDQVDQLDVPEPEKFGVALQEIATEFGVDEDALVRGAEDERAVVRGVAEDAVEGGVVVVERVVGLLEFLYQFLLKVVPAEGVQTPELSETVVLARLGPPELGLAFEDGLAEGLNPDDRGFYLFAVLEKATGEDVVDEMVGPLLVEAVAAGAGYGRTN
jgi:hypothetical protein